MDYLPDIFACEDAYCEVTNAFCFSKEAVFILIDARSEVEELTGSALVKVTLSADPVYKVLHEFDSSSLDYHAEHPELHYVLASGGFIHRIDGGNLTVFPYASDEFLDNLARIDEASIAVFGERGLVFRFEGGEYRQISTSTEEALHAMHFPRPNLGYAGGNYGAFLRGDGVQFSSIELGEHAFVRALHVKDDGQILIACEEGTSFVLHEDELTAVKGNTEDFYSVNEFDGTEYWGDDGFGVYTRSGSEFIPKFETGYAFNINTNNELMTINAGYWVYIFDGSSWVQLQVNAELDRLIERVPLDFEPL